MREPQGREPHTVSLSGDKATKGPQLLLAPLLHPNAAWDWEGVGQGKGGTVVFN